ncbi:MAG TPA: ferrous iron transport protein A [Lachnoclostridium phytofermentans]|uniref:Ferrous iron transport protein A n=1 Tax=Lachnoclostridium phytofermentans TaxID=66219 RepID=A0A3D2X4P6_9FIRM|nr:FeoA family protein [Lachnoclostridium sp.]HCL01687.1 ferrous iron transport protein A [Lachnoclostridium phytofermentans]
MPLSMAKKGEVSVIQNISGKEETKRFLESLGFVTGSLVTIVSELGGNIIVNIKESRVALNKELASKIMIQIQG